jgi:hypothetical protein
MDWLKRSAETRNLLNPSFCSILLWSAARGYAEQSQKRTLPFEIAFLILPIVLHRGTRELLPRTPRTSLAVWLDENPLVRAHITERARLLVPFTRETLMFGGLYGVLKFSGRDVIGPKEWHKKISETINGCSAEVKECIKKAEFIGKWFAKTGTATTIMALLGVKP